MERREEMIFSKIVRKEPNFLQLKRQMLNRMVKDEYEGLTISFNFLTPQQKIDFFTQEGYDLLHYAISMAQDLKALSFICKNIPGAVLKTVLGLHDFSILTSFLNAQCIMENYLGIGNIDRLCRISKFNAMWQIDPEGIMDFVSTNSDMPYMSTFIKKDLEVAMGVTTTHVPVYQ